MTKMEQLTMAAMNGLLQNTNYAGMPGHLIAKRAYEVAEATADKLILENVNDDRPSRDLYIKVLEERALLFNACKSAHDALVNIVDDEEEVTKVFNGLNKVMGDLEKRGLTI